MRIIALSLVTVGWLAGAPAHAQTPDSENGRYSFHQVTEGTLRLDSRTGQVSLCARQGSSWSCAAAALPITISVTALDQYASSPPA
mgnify:CR=1 FL=1